MNAWRTSCFSIELARIRISNALISAQHRFKLRSAGEDQALLTECAMRQEAVAQGVDRLWPLCTAMWSRGRNGPPGCRAEGVSPRPAFQGPSGVRGAVLGAFEAPGQGIWPVKPRPVRDPWNSSQIVALLAAVEGWHYGFLILLCHRLLRNAIFSKKINRLATCAQKY
jgi:hypothetical protein